MKRILLFSKLNVLMLTCFWLGLNAGVDKISSSEEACMECFTAPFLFCPSTYFGCPGDNLDPLLIGQPVALPGEATCPNPVVSYTDTLIIDSPCYKKYHRIWKAQYPAGEADPKLLSQCVQTIILEDDSVPVITNCPLDITVDLIAQCDSTATWTAPQASDNCGFVSLTSNYMPGDTFTSGNTIVSYIAEDFCGQRDTCSFTVSVMGVCCENLALACPSDTIVCINSILDPIETGMATVAMPDSSCTNPFISYIDTIIGSPSECGAGLIIERTWLASDSAQLNVYASCTQLITTLDTISPVIQNIPSDITVTGLGMNCTPTVQWTDPTVNDDCGIFAFAPNISNGSSFPEGTSTVTYIALDNCGNTASASFQVTVECDISCQSNPVINCPVDISICPQDSMPSPDITGYATAFPGDSLCQAPIVSYADSIVSTGSCGSMVIHRIWSATDPDNSNLSSICTQSITMEDNLAPVISNMPSNITITVDAVDCSVPVAWVPPSVQDNCGVQSFNSNYQIGDILSAGTTAVVYTAVDHCGNSSTNSFNITIECTPACAAPPMLICPANYWACPDGGSIPGPDISGYAVAYPATLDCGQPVVTYNDVIVSSGPCPTSKVIERTWTATDPDNSSLFTSCIQILSLEDTELPTILYCPTDITVNTTGYGSDCGTNVSWNSPLATDNCGAPLLSAEDQWGDPVSNGQVFYNGTTSVTYTATDNCGNISQCSFSVTVSCSNPCSTPPVISCPPNYWACPEGNSIPGPSISGYATAVPGSNTCSQPVINYQDYIVSTGPCQTAKVVERVWTATDPNNPSASSSCTQILSLEDIQPPSILYCPTDITVNTNGSGTYCSTNVSWNSPLATDNCGAPYLSAYDEWGDPVSNGQLFYNGVTQVTYTAQDNCGNETHCVFNVTVVCNNNICNTPPSIYCPVNKTVCPGSSISPSATGWATATGGNYCPTPDVDYTDLIISTGPCYGEKVISRTWTADYYNNNLSNSCVQYIYVKDDTPPVFNYCPADITVYDSSTPVYWNSPQATDNCGSVNLSSNYNPGSYFPVGTTTVNYIAEDNCWNPSYCSFTVTVINQYNINVNCSSDLYLNCNSGTGAVANWNPPTFSGACNNCDNGNYIPGFVFMGSLNGSQYYCSTTSATWPQAKAVCESKGGHLVSINSQEENNYLANILTLQSAWIGLSDHLSEGSFKWTNGDALNYTNWYPGQPNNYNNNQDYVEIMNNGQWNDQYNYYSLEYIMEIPCSSIEQVSGPTPGSLLSGGSYTVSYEVEDGCGGYGTCSFNIYVDGGLDVSCQDDIVVTAQPGSTGVVVNWEEPTVSTCCSGCNQNGQSYQGFVYMGSLNGHDYYCSTYNASWPQAKAFCEANGGHLAIINSQAENNFLSGLITTQSAWIGLSDSNSEGNFQWVDGSGLSYTNWYPGQPNNYSDNQDYVELLDDGQWNDQYNYYSLEFIMEVPSCISVNQTSGPANGSLLQAGTQHVVSYSIADACGNTEYCSFTIDVQASNTTAKYCDSQGDNSLDYFIEEVRFAQMSNNSGDDNGYGDYTDLSCAVLTQGLSYHISLVPSSLTQDRNYWRVWIDLNKDGDFYDQFEMVAYGSGVNTVSGLVTLPTLLWSGETRMRVIASPIGYPSDPCGNYSLGETEDYCVVVLGSSGSKPSVNQISTRSSEKASAALLKEDLIVSDNKVYPNPATDWVNIELSHPEAISNITITDATGRIVRTLNSNSDNAILRVDTHMLSGGIYFVEIIDIQNKKDIHKLIISR